MATMMLGVDVAKRSLEYALVSAEDQQVICCGTVSNTERGLRRLLRLVPAEAPWVLEPTGRYSTLAVESAHQAGRQVLLAPPRLAKLFALSLQTRAKCDRLDARALAQFGLSRPLREYRLKEPLVEELQQLLAVRRQLSQSRMRLQQQADALPLAAAQLAPTLEHLTAELRRLDQQVAELVAEHEALEAVRRLQQIDGIGPLTAASVGAVLADKQFPHGKQFVAYLGLDVGVRASGAKQGEIGLTKQGHAELRRLLYCCAQATLTMPHSPFHELYDKKRAEGLASTAALCVVARKLAMCCWSLWTHGGEFERDKVLGST